MSITKTTWHHIRRSPFQSFAAISTLSFSFFVFAFFYILSTGLSSTLKFFESKPEITIFLKDGLDKNTVESVQEELKTYPNLREIKFVSKEKALEIYKEQNKNNPMLTEMVTASILPASFEISAMDPNVLSEIAKNFNEKKDVVDEIIYQKDVVESLIMWTTNIRHSGIILMLVLAILAFFVIFIIIGMKITNRKDEIRISRLLGASKFYTKKAFLLEGIIYGIIGSSLGCLIASLLVYRFSNDINNFFKPVIFIESSLNFYLKIFGIANLSGITIAYLASLIGVRRYIKY